jgi:uncharacterized protein (DUF2252 family)
MTAKQAKTHNLFRQPAPSIEDRRAAGKALRAQIPRESHADWTPAPHRPDPVDIIVASNTGREANLVPIRHARMLASPFAFLRGSAAVMAWDLAQTPATGLRVQACGDCHLMNFGAFATPERNLIFDINDFDETLPAPWEWDVKRLAASAAVAGRHIGLSDGECRRIARAAARSYCEHMRDYSRMTVLRIWYDRIGIGDVLDQITNPATKKRVEERLKLLRQKTVADFDYPKLVENVDGEPRIKESPPLIYHSADQKMKAWNRTVTKGLQQYRESLSDHCRVLFDRFQLRDLAMKVVGVGSVGTSCWIALHTASDGDPMFLQVKQANASVLEPYAGKSQYEHHGQRVVAGQRLMQAASDILLGWTMGDLRGRHFYVRQLRDMKLSAVIESMDAERLQSYVAICGWALARAHANSGDPVTISGYLGGGTVFSEAIAEFALRYADQTDRDHRAMAQAVSAGKIRAMAE